MIFGDLEGLKFPNICLTGKEKSRKNLTQETCPDRGSKPDPLRDRRACYRLLHSGALTIIILSRKAFDTGTDITNETNLSNSQYDGDF